MKKQISLGLIGIGYWGLNYVRIFSELPNTTLKFVFDLDQKRLKLVKKTSPTIKLTPDYKEILNDREVDAVVVATPATTHYQIIKDCLEKNKNVLAEKPLTLK